MMGVHACIEYSEYILVPQTLDFSLVRRAILIWVSQLEQNQINYLTITPLGQSQTGVKQKLKPK